jgi:3-phenylpropionate/cinnamic acid dioxygenase small subunit
MDDNSAVHALSLSDRLEIREVAALYGILIDDRDWPGLASVFTDDAVFIIAGRHERPEVRVESLEALREFMTGANHPKAHHVTNVVVQPAPGEGEATMRSKVIAVLPKASAGTADYRDRLRRTPAGWRIYERVVTIRG